LNNISSVTSHAFILLSSVFGRVDLFISHRGKSFGFIAMSGVMLGVNFEKKFPRLGQLVVERESRDEFSQLIDFSQ